MQYLLPLPTLLHNVHDMEYNIERKNWSVLSVSLYLMPVFCISKHLDLYPYV